MKHATLTGGRRARFVASALLAVVLVVAARPAKASKNGIDSTVFGATGCPLCHGGGNTPSVVLSGPTAVAPNSTNDYTVTIFSDAGQDFGGFNIAAPLGTLQIGGPFAAGTKAVPGALGLAEITHTAPKQGDFLNTIEFSFRWTAPAAFSGVTLRAWGNAVNGNNLPSGDAADLATLDVVSTLLESSTPTASPTPTPTPQSCGDAAPLSPALVADPDAALCQAAIAKAAAVYMKKDLQAVRRCLDDFQAEAPGGNPMNLCVGTAGTGPTDARAATTISKAQIRTIGRLQAKCSDAAVAALDLCADTEIHLESCFLAQHRQRVIDAIAAEYGFVVPSADRGEQKCQRAIGRAGAGYLLAYLRASQKCLVRRNKDGGPSDGAAQCVGALVANSFVAPLDVKVSHAIGNAAAKLGKKIGEKCDAARLAALAACGSDQASTVACLLCNHRRVVFGLISNEFGGL